MISNLVYFAPEERFWLKSESLEFYPLQWPNLEKWKVANALTKLLNT